MSKTKSLLRKIKLERTKCLVVTCIPCNTPYPDKESKFKCANCGMLDWLTFETEEECNKAYKKEYPNEFDSNGKYIIK